MIKFGAKVFAKTATKHLREIHTKVIPRASANAYRHSGKMVITAASKELAASLGVQVWLVRGQKGKGSRFGLTRYIKKVEGGFLHFRTRHINPAGTKHKESKVSTTKRGVRAQGKLYPGAFAKKFRYTNAVYTRTGSGLNIESREITEAHINRMRRTSRKVFLKNYRIRFEQQLARGIKKHGTL